LHSSVDSRLLLFTLLVIVAAGILSGLAPALQTGRRSIVASLRERGGVTGGVRLRKAIVTLQIAFTLILVIGAALFARTLTTLMAKGPGFATSSLVSFGIDPMRNGYTRQQASALTRRLHEELRTSPITESSAVARMTLLTGGSWNNPMTIQTTERIATDRDVHINAITPGFFTTLEVKLIAGRDFDARDTKPVGQRGERSAIVNQAFVKRYLPGRNPLGARICQGAGPDAKPNIEIVGVVADVSYRGLREENEQAYLPLFEGNDQAGAFYVRVRGTPERAFASIRTLVHNADPALPITYLRTVDEQVNRSLSAERILATLSAAFGTLALLLSLVGLYGVMSFVVTQRTREIGIRLALGATQRNALWLVLRDALVMIAAGTSIALPAVAALGRLVESQLFGVKPTDPLTIAAATLVLASAALAAALIPARRASTLNPTDALRFD
ncbi:MAG: FtsX-like permease family protein, partial [Bryobacteraceae bacterium]